jgi:methanogenic corrinoid protein MtbC1
MSTDSEADEGYEMNLSNANLLPSFSFGSGLWQPIHAAVIGSLSGRSEDWKVPTNDVRTKDHDSCKASLLDVIESQIIPRLIEAHPASEASNAQAFDAAYKPSQQEIEHFAQICLAGDEKPAFDFVQALISKEIGNDNIFLHLLAPAARHLGQLWSDDVVDFTQVTLGLMRMHQITHKLGFEYTDGPQHASAVRRVMLASAPGSQHLLGLTIVAEFFRKNGWQVVVEIANSAVELDHAAKNEWFDLIGLSVGLTEQINALPELISRIKSSSKNPAVSVLLGGPAFLHSEVTAASLGADGISTDAAQAVTLGASLLRA